jgi:ABC-type Fe3+ transport system substrate-binding protein
VGPVKVRFSAIVLASIISACSAAPAGSGASPASSSAGATAAAVTADADVRAAFDAIKGEMPGVSIDLVQAAKKEGALQVYQAALDGPRRVVEGFNKDFPFIKAEYLEGPNQQLLDRFQSEENAGRHLADVVQSTDPALADPILKAGLAATYQATSDAKYPASTKRSGTAYPASGLSLGIGWNTSKVTDADGAALAKWDGPADPRFASKKFGLYDPNASGGATLQGYYAQYRAFGAKTWQAVGKLKPALYANGNTASAALAAGEVDIYFPVSIASLEVLRAKGGPIHYAYAEPVVIVPSAQFISAKAPHPNAARLFQEYSLTLKAQTIYLANGSDSVLPGVPDTRAVAKEPWFKGPQGREAFPIDYPKFQAEWPTIVKEWNAAILGK